MGVGSFSHAPSGVALGHGGVAYVGHTPFLNDLLDSVCGRGLFQPHPFLTNQLDWLLGVWLC